jgi:hypothetical protein
MFYFITQQRDIVIIIKMPQHCGAIVGGGGLKTNNCISARPDF